MYPPAMYGVRACMQCDALIRHIARVLRAYTYRSQRPRTCKCSKIGSVLLTKQVWSVGKMNFGINNTSSEEKREENQKIHTCMTWQGVVPLSIHSWLGFGYHKKRNRKKGRKRRKKKKRVSNALIHPPEPNHASCISKSENQPDN